MDEQCRWCCEDATDKKDNCDRDSCSTVEHFNYTYNKALDDFLKKLKHEYSVLAKELPKEYKSVCENFEKIAKELRK